MNVSELILNENGSIYHLNLLPGDLAKTIILVGDPDRVPKVSTHFDEIILKKQKREFITHTGMLNEKKISVISTGIGVGNIDIVMNEADALFNLDFETNSPKKDKTQLNFIRIGTSGSLDESILADEFVVSKSAVGFDGLMHFYPEYKIENKWFDDFKHNFPYDIIRPFLYYSEADEKLVSYFSDAKHIKITGTLLGFYAPQGRKLRLSTIDENMLEKLNQLGISNFEMETSMIYAFSSLLGHKAVTVNAILANRKLESFSSNPKETEKKLIAWCIERIKNNVDLV
ncbi:MAG: nucleoside phosphorylase [Flavobacteriales bacterium]|nr:nucleoside phosphorylase [Flavobacteriales bacterium]